MHTKWQRVNMVLIKLFPCLLVSLIYSDLKKLASKETLLKRATKQARDAIVKKLTKGKGKGELSFAQRASIEKKVDKKKAAIAKIAKKKLPDVKKADKAKLKKNKEKS